MLEVENFEKQLIEYYSEPKEDFFMKNIEDCLFMKNNLLKEYDKQLQNINSGLRYVLESLAWLHLDRAIYGIYNEDIESKSSLAYARSYAYQTIVSSSKACGCLEYNPFLEMKCAGVLLDLQVLLGSQKDIIECTQTLVDSLNAKSCLIRRGDAKSLQAWFSIELLSKVHNIEIFKKRTRYPKEFAPYDDVLEKWDTTDLNDVDIFVTVLCMKHIEIVKANQPKPKEDTFLYIVGGGIQEDEVEFLSLPFIQIVPYEILMWLRLRKLQGLENPKAYSHPLMNTQVAKMFLEIKEPLEELKELPYINELLVKLEQKCIEMKSNKDNENIQVTITQTDITKPAPKTGNYQATLPKDHPQYETLKADPQAYHSYKEGEAFDNRGLEVYDLKNIEWVFVE